MAEATTLIDGCIAPYTLTAAVVAGQVVQLPDGRAAVAVDGYAAGALGHFYVEGVFTVEKTTTMVMLPGSRVFWDHSANKAHLLHGGDKDFYLGVVTADAASAATTVLVNLNAHPAEIGLDSGFASVVVGSATVAGNGEGVQMTLIATSEAEKVDAMSYRSFAVLTPVIVEALICVNVNPASVGDLNVGIANATHATDADSITESMFVHIDGGSTNIALESDDGTTEVAATDSTLDFAAGTPFLVQFDLRTAAAWADAQVYVNGVNVLPASVFNIAVATGPMKLLAHFEKTTGTEVGSVTVLRLTYRTFDAQS